MTSRQSQSSCRLSGYSEHQGHGASASVAASVAAAATLASAQRSVAAAAAAAAAASQSQDQMSYYHNSSSNNMDLEPVLASETFAMDTAFDLGVPDDQPSMPAAQHQRNNAEFMQTVPPSQVYMTPMQMQMFQQLKAKHSALFKSIANMQEELRRVNEQMLMTQGVLVPVSQPTLMVSSHSMALTQPAQQLVQHQSQPVFGTLEMPTMGYAVQPSRTPFR